MCRLIVLGILAVLPHVTLGQDEPPPASPSFEDRLRELESKNSDLQWQLDALKASNARSPDSDTDGPGLRRSGRSSDFDNQPEDIRTDQPEETPKSYPTIPSFYDGFRWETKDGEYSLVFHNETQLEFRAYTQSGSDPNNQFGFDIRRMRLYFNGNLTKPIEYSLSINKGPGDLDLLDAYFNFKIDPAFQVRFGRYRVPFLYDWYALSNQFLPTPERSVFAVNYGYNRNFALMVHGELFEDAAEYAGAIANGPRNQYIDYNGGKDFLGFFNFRPFMHSEEFTALKYWNIGGSVTYGIESQAAVPFAFRTSLNADTSDKFQEIAPAFLTLTPGVMERGARNMWEVHSAWYWKSLTLMGAWDIGYNDYSLTATSREVRVPTHGFHVGVSYFITGEEITRRTLIDPLRPLRIGTGETGTGAIELQCRVSEFDVGSQIFSDGIADANLWTNRVTAVDVGFNWYLNRYTKLYFDFQRSNYASPVQYAPGKLHSSDNLFWIRSQIYF